MEKIKELERRMKMICGDYPLRFFAALEEEADEETLEFLWRDKKIEEEDKDGDSPLFLAARNNPNPKVLRWFLKMGASPNKKGSRASTPLRAAAIHNPNPEVAKALMEGGADEEPGLIEAVKKQRDDDTLFMTKEKKERVLEILMKK